MKTTARPFNGIHSVAIVLPLLLAALWCQSGHTADAASKPSVKTITVNREFSRALKLDDQQDFADASRGLIAVPSGKILADDGRVLIDFDDFKFVSGPAPDTVNPSLWRHALLNANRGLFKVTDGIYQLRGFDVANMTLVDGATGWIVIDTLTSRESAAAALAFARAHLGNKPVSAVIFSHSHVDHFGGVLGVVSKKEVAERGIPVIASHGFMEEATSENIMAGVVMTRRSSYQFGKDLPRSATGMVDTGLGKAVAYGTVGILEPTILIEQPEEERLVDGVRFVFHNVPGAEAPAEMTFSIPDKKAYGGAENLAQTMHNLLPIRGAKVRDALLWSTYLDQALDQLGDATVYFGQHNWPVWGHDHIVEFITKQRDVYKYIHDQTVRLMNEGYTPREIADQLKLPESLASYLGARGYYGDLRHNVKAVYQFYLGAYDGNPANLNLLPPQESAKRYVTLLGGVDKVVAAGQLAFDQGDYRWAAELLNHAVFAQSGNVAAKELLAKTYDQLAYAAESATWRNSYLTAANELRDGLPNKNGKGSDYTELFIHTPTERFLEAMAASLNGSLADGKNLKINLTITDTNDSYVLWIENAVLHFRKAAPTSDANASMSLPKPLFVALLSDAANREALMQNPALTIQGSAQDVDLFFSLFARGDGNFAIVTK